MLGHAQFSQIGTDLGHNVPISVRLGHDLAKFGRHLPGLARVEQESACTLNLRSSRSGSSNVLVAAKSSALFAAPMRDRLTPRRTTGVARRTTEKTNRRRPTDRRTTDDRHLTAGRRSSVEGETTVNRGVPDTDLDELGPTGIARRDVYRHGTPKASASPTTSDFRSFLHIAVRSQLCWRSSAGD